MSHTNATLTLLTSHKPAQLTKVISLSKDGKMIKQPSAQLIEGTAEVKSLATISDFSNLLVGLTADQALVYGVPNEGMTSAKVVTKRRYDQLGTNTQGYITRTNDHFDWSTGGGVMMFDYDPNGEALDKEAVLNILYEVCPAIRDVDHLWWMSSSSNITNTETGEPLSAITGQRIYVLVADATDIPRAAKVINDKLWLAGHGYIKISASGATLERATFDMSVYQPSRLDFAAGAACVSPLAQNRGEPSFIQGNARMLDTALALPDLTSDEVEQLNTLKLGKQATNKPKAMGMRIEFIEKMKTKLLAHDENLDSQLAQESIVEALEKGSLPPSWPLQVWTGKEMLEVTVEQVLLNKYQFDGMLCCDPIEPDYDGSRLVGKLYLNQKTPMIHSFARGEQSYELLNRAYHIDLVGNIYGAVEDTFTVLEQRQEIMSYGDALVMPANGNLVAIDRHGLIHYLSGIIQYFRGNKPCDPSKDLVEILLSMNKQRLITPVKGMVDHPIIDTDLVMVQQRGYVGQAQLMLDFDASDFTVTDRLLTLDELRHHMTLINAPFVGFDLVSSADKSMLYAAIFSAVVRQVLPICPAFAMDAPMQGSGKTLLAETIGMLATGKKITAMPPIGQTTDNEIRKRLLPVLMKGEKACLFDNLVGEFDSAAFATAITAEYFEDRELGYSRTVKVLTKTLFLLTGNNLNITGDMTRRVLRMRLTPVSDQLTKRKYDFDPLEKVSEMRPQIISSVLSLINHWKHMGCPRAEGTMTSFTDWDTLVRQPLAHIGGQLTELGLMDVLDVANAQQADSSDKEAIVALFVALAKCYGNDNPFKAGDAFKLLDTNEVLQDAVYAFKSKSSLGSSQHLGSLFKAYVDRNVEGLVLKSKKVSGSWSYWIEVTDDTHRHEIVDTRSSSYTAKPRHLSPVRSMPIRHTPLILGG